MTAEIITIGDEILTGHTVNTNAAFIAERLTEIDCRVTRETTVGDDPSAIAAVLRDAMPRADVVIVSGGLGPTHDDITRTAIAQTFGRPLRMNAEVRELMVRFFAARGRELDQINETQALLPEGADFVPNSLGTAVGIHLVEHERHCYALPGVPEELRAMLMQHIVHFLKTMIEPRTAWSALCTTGKPESRLYAMLRPVLERHPEVKVAFLPGSNGVKIRCSASLRTLEQSERALEIWRDEARQVLGTTFYSATDEAIERVIGVLLGEKHATLAVAESCTGGLIAWRITEVPGSSNYFLRGYVTYSNQAKSELLGVDPGAIETEGAVSEAVAFQMADGARSRSGADYAVAVTGIAGPGGGTQTKPVGLTYVAVAGGGPTVCRKHQLGQTRSTNRRRAAQIALNLLRERLLGEV
jgi:nicotinamide-nucleotide amidase